MTERTQAPCSCGHDRALHDQYGCAAFLGAFPHTARFQRYCPCKRPGGVVLAVDRIVHADDRRAWGKVVVEAD